MATSSPLESSPIRLTELTDCGGCAAKLGADVLAEALAGLGAGTGAADPALIAGLEPPDDAAAYRISDDLAILGTLDFFPPLVDDPATYGEIAAANALSDVFAMGGRVLFALSIAAFPEDFPREALSTVFEAAAGKVREAGGMLAGGHTIRDAEPKYGLAVIGAAHPDRLFRKGGARPGDVLILTKRLGTGLLVSGRRQGRVDDAALGPAIEQMRTLNRAASEVFVATRDPRRDGCHGLRSARPRPRDGEGVPGAAGVPRGGAARARWSAGGRARWHRDGRRGPQPSLHRAIADRRGRRPARARRAGARPADLGWPAGGGAGGGR